MISGVTFEIDAIRGAVCLFESMASMLPFVDELIVFDLGSSDGTLAILQDISSHNPKIRIVNSKFSSSTPAAFADMANECIAACEYDNVIFWQADEIWHQNVLKMMKDKFEEGIYDLAFWRIQLKTNFQEVGWFPHPIHRVGPKDNFVFVEDGMNSDRTYGVDICSEYNMGWFQKWGDMNPMDLPMQEFVLDISKKGGFLDSIRNRAIFHAPMWNEVPNIDGKPIDDWYSEQINNPQWDLPSSPFNIPQIMKGLVGKRKYEVRPELIEALKSDDTRKLIGVM